MSRSKYGRDRVAQIITFGTLQARAVLRDVGPGAAAAAGHGRPPGQDGARTIPANPGHPGPGDRDRAAAASRPAPTTRPSPSCWTSALQLEGLYRNASTHAAGVVIGDRPLTELVPLYRDPRSDIAGHPVQHEVGRERRPGEVRLPGPEDPDRASTGRCKLPGEARRGGRSGHACRWTTRTTYELMAARPDGRGVPAGRPGHARHPAQAAAHLASRTSPP